jgi:hypothetical protein
MTVQIFERRSGDTGPPINDILDGVTDLNNATGIVAALTRNREPSGSCPVTVVDPITREVEVDLSAWLPTARNGDWKINYVVTFASLDRWTWESGRADVVRVGRNPMP